MSRKTAKSLAQLVDAQGSSLGKLALEAKRRATLSEYLRTELPTPLGSGIVHCNIQSENTVTVLAASPEWAARLRFAAAEILALSQDKEPELERVKVSVAP